MATEIPQSTPPTVAATAAEEEEQVQDQGIEADDNTDADSAYDGGYFSDTTSLTSSITRGRLENGRKYQALREDYWGPSDGQQFESMEMILSHLMFLIHDHSQPQPLFRSPIKEPQNILDLGTGKGDWAIDVADEFPSAIVHGVDLFPPPSPWVPPNCFLEVEDILQRWSWRQKFDLIHLRLLFGAFTDPEWEHLYEECFAHIEPGGWIEQVEADVRVLCDDDTLPADSNMASWGPEFLSCGERSGRKLDTIDTFATRIEKAGFVDIHEQDYKFPVGPWAKGKVYKELGRANLIHWDRGLEGWAMWLLTKYGGPPPWSKEEVQVYVAKMKLEMKDPRIHSYVRMRRVWARKPGQSKH
ncbi:S-adenosyl-L-methionine-dependent methyltransferase [Zopfia rhizophila CBS 207.26]|uniref:S-adenosyl-L-methionine-dependent methyltransferase n=1 Tax=Zopfia rhizophila CBS 207.26 TaxID=1314779 RepID=A0A6A6DE26_9PEZI|nr:S-adenosyl-L-methionine-dependent methyltransferase [Zopfia rhizophila CBS 207.26]